MKTRLAPELYCGHLVNPGSWRLSCIPQCPECTRLDKLSFKQLVREYVAAIDYAGYDRYYRDVVEPLEDRLRRKVQ